ncbi:MAG: ADP-glyceromanno-heptose 6-epimerase [Candidatus Kapabacteria bacterium]|nr:ADP-glyceromanno-heptose 6-epimerase [Candidatus Kapabacteria bacterium]
MIILTGGAGFIGSCVLRALNDAGRADVLIVDSLRSGTKWKNLVGKKFVDLLSKEQFRSVITGDAFEFDVDAVIHLGACSSTTESDADYLYDNNYLYSIDVAEFAIGKNARFIYASSAATYGDGSLGYSDASVDLRPLNMYGFSKHLFDNWIRESELTDSCVGLKLFNVFGPNEEHKGDMRSMVAKAFDQIQDTGGVQLFASNDDAYADGGQMRDFIYVKDVVNVIMSLLGRPDVNGIYNLGTGKARTWNDLVKAVSKSMKKRPKITYIDMPDQVKGQYQNFTQADMTRFANVLPDVSFTSLEDAVSDYVGQHLMQNRATY